MKCLVTKHDAVVNNDLLPTLGELIIRVPANAPLTNIPIRSVRGDIPVIVSITNGNVLSLSRDMTSTFTEKTVSFSSDDYFWVRGINVNSYIKIKSNYYLANFGGNPTVLDYNDMSFKRMLIYSSKAPRIINFGVNTNGIITGDLSVFANISSFVNFTVNDKSVTGDISNLGSSIGLQNISIKNTKITGSIETLCSALKNNGKTSGTLKIIGNGIVTYQNAAIQDGVSKTVTFTDSGYTVK